MERNINGMNGHILKEWEDTGLFSCIKCNKAEVELEDECLK